MTSLKDSGLAHFRAGRHDLAADDFRLAAQEYLAANDPLNAAEMANNLSVTLLLMKDFAGALDAVQGTAAVFQRAGDRVKQGQAVGNEAAALEGLGRLAEAAGLYQQAAEIFEQAGENEQRATTLRALAAVQLKQGKAAEAVFTMQGGLEGAEIPSLAKRTLSGLFRIPSRLLGRW